MAELREVRTASRLVRWGVLLLGACDWNMMGPSSCVGSVTVSPPSAAGPVGQTVQLYATARDTAGNVLSDVAVTWTSDNTALATVGRRGGGTDGGNSDKRGTERPIGNNGDGAATSPGSPRASA